MPYSLAPCLPWTTTLGNQEPHATVETETNKEHLPSTCTPLCYRYITTNFNAIIYVKIISKSIWAEV